MPEKKLHIVCICTGLNFPGGIERAIVNTVNLLQSKNYIVSLVILDETSNSFYSLDSSIVVRNQFMNFGITEEGNLLSRKIRLVQDLYGLRRLIKSIKPDLVLSTDYQLNVAAVIALKGLKIKIIGWEHHHLHELQKNKFWRILVKHCYPYLSAIVCLNKDEQELYQKLNKNVIIIPNFIIPTETTNTSEKEKILLTVARLEKVKGIDLLLKVALNVLKENLDWQWKLIGNGTLKNDVQKFVADHNLHNRLILQEPVDNYLLHEYSISELYVMTSRNECFPMTLLEAMERGLPCISFDCNTGPRHIITNNIDGCLIEKEDVIAMSHKINTLISTSTKRKKMGESAYENIKRFSPENIYTLWNQLFQSLA